MKTSDLIESVRNGKDVHSVVSRALGEDLEIPDREDMSPDEKADVFAAAVNRFSEAVPYLNHEYVDDMLSQIRDGAPDDELLALAQRNREQYAGDHRIEGAGFETWDVIYRALAAGRTES